MSNYSSLIEAFRVTDFDQPAVEVEYRLYYDVKGKPTIMSCNSGPDGNYIVIDQTTYEQGITPLMRVFDNELVYIDQASFKSSLQKSIAGYPVVKNHPALLIETNEHSEQVDYYAKTN